LSFVLSQTQKGGSSEEKKGKWKNENKRRKCTLFMPIGVPRIIYSWGEDLPAQWTDIYNFIFRRRMVFLMQYLDDELCNQICGLLINIHMEDRSKELEKKEMEGTLKNTLKKESRKTDTPEPFSSFKKGGTTSEDLLNSDEDLGIDAINTLEQDTLQKITKEWLNWNSQFFDYKDSEHPYLAHLAQTLTQDFGNTENKGETFYNFKKGKNVQFNPNDKRKNEFQSRKGLDIYSAFRTSLNITPDLSLKKRHPFFKTDSSFPFPDPDANRSGYLTNPRDKTHLYTLFSKRQASSLWEGKGKSNGKEQDYRDGTRLNELVPSQKKAISKYLSLLAGLPSHSHSHSETLRSEMTSLPLGQRQLKKHYRAPFHASSSFSSLLSSKRRTKKGYSSSQNYSPESRDFYRKQTERTFLEEESKKVFVIINSFGGSVGNGITVHDALQFIKAGSLTLGLGVAASASSLVLAGGSIGERYVTEGCHTMIHQPECCSPDHDVLTDKGWIPIAEVTLENKVAVLKEGKYLAYEHPTKIHSFSYHGNMYQVKTDEVDCLVTPNHRMYVCSSSFENPTDLGFDFREASALQGQKVRYKRNATWEKPDYQLFFSRHPNSSELSRESSDEFGFGREFGPDGAKTEETLTQPLKVQMEPFLKLLGLCLLEGWTEKRKRVSSSLRGEEDGDSFNADQNESLVLWQKKKENMSPEYTEKQLSLLGLKYTKRSFDSLYSFTLYRKEFFPFFEPYRKRTSERCLPDWVWELSREQCCWLLEGLRGGKGSFSPSFFDMTDSEYKGETGEEEKGKGKGTNKLHFVIRNQKLAFDLSRLLFHAGYVSTLSKFELTSSDSEGPMWRINVFGFGIDYGDRIGKENAFYPSVNDTDAKKDSFVPYTGMVHCLTVPGGLFYTQRNGYPVWTGNSSLQGQASDIWIDSQEIMKIRLDVSEIYSLSTYRPRHKILRDLDRDFYLTAPETIAYGLADEIATNEVMHEIVEMTAKVWDVYEGQQQRLLEKRENTSSAEDSETGTASSA